MVLWIHIYLSVTLILNMPLVQRYDVSAWMGYEAANKSQLWNYCTTYLHSKFRWIFHPVNCKSYQMKWQMTRIEEMLNDSRKDRKTLFSYFQTFLTNLDTLLVFNKAIRYWYQGPLDHLFLCLLFCLFSFPFCSIEILETLMVSKIDYFINWFFFYILQ